MKFDDHLAAYLHEYKSLKLEGIGTFTLDEKTRVPNEQEKEVSYPVEGLVFTYNSKSDTEEEVIFFLVKKLHKIEPLIRSDLESYLTNIRIFLNIGNPYTIEGIGTLHKNNQGRFELTPVNSLPAKEEPQPKRKNEERNQPGSKIDAARVFVIILIVVSASAAIGGISWGVLHFSTKQATAREDPRPPGQTDATIPNADTITDINNPTLMLPDTNILPRRTQPVGMPTVMPDSVASITYKMVFEVTKSKERAHSRTIELKNLHSYTGYDSIPINDSVAYYRLFLLMKVSSADTTRVKDSLQRLLQKRIFMEKVLN